MNTRFEPKQLVYRTPLVDFGITPLMKEMILDKAAKGDALSPDDLEALALARDSQFLKGELGDGETTAAIQDLGDAAREPGGTKSAAVYGAAILSLFIRRALVSDRLSWLARAALDGLAGAAFPLAGWYADRVAERDLGLFPDLDLPGFESGYEPAPGRPPVAFPQNLAECVEQAFLWSLAGLAEKVFECDEILAGLPVPDELVDQHVDLLEKAVAADSFAAKRLLAGHLFRENASAAEHARGLGLFRELAQDGSPDDFFALSLALKETVGEQPGSTPEEAFEWCRKAAEGGIAPAMRELGLHYGEGFGAEKDQGLSVKWMCDAADAGDGEARLITGALLLDAAKTPKEAREAVSWIRLAAEENDVPAAWAQLARAYETGLGLYVNKKKSAACLKRARELGWKPDSEPHAESPNT